MTKSTDSLGTFLSNLFFVLAAPMFSFSTLDFWYGGLSSHSKSAQIVLTLSYFLKVIFSENFTEKSYIQFLIFCFNKNKIFCRQLKIRILNNFILASSFRKWLKQNVIKHEEFFRQKKSVLS